MINRLGLVIHWAGFICIVGLIGVYTLGIFTGSFSRGFVYAASETIEFLFDSPPDGNPVWWIWWAALTHWPIKFIITGNKNLFPWNKVNNS